MRTAAVVRNSPRRWCVPVIPVLVTVMVVATSAAPATEMAEVLPARLSVTVDPRVELFSVIYHLAEIPRRNHGQVLSSYETEIDRYFWPHRNHPAVALVAHLVETRERSPAKWFDYGVQVSLAVHVTDVNTLEMRVPLDPWPETLHRRWTPELIDEFLGKVRDFARQTDFSEFFERQRAFYSATTSRPERALRDGVGLKWFDRFFGPRPDAEFFVFISPLSGPSNFAFWIRGKDVSEAISVTGVRQSQWLFPWTGGVPVTVHEFIHFYVNPAAESHLDGLVEAVDRIKPSLTGDFAKTIKGVETPGFVNESLVRAVVIRYLDSRWGALAARVQLAREMKSGLFWMPELLDTLEVYEAERNLYPNLEAFMPQVVEFVQDYSMQIESKAAIARAANAALPACVALLAAWGIATSLLSRRASGKKIRTWWTWLFKVSLFCAFMVAAVEFVLLANRPGLFSMFLGGALLVSAFVMEVKSLSGMPPRALPDAELGPTNRTCPYRHVPRARYLSFLFVLTGAPLLLSARFAWGFSAVAILAMLLQARAEDRALAEDL